MDTNSHLFVILMFVFLIWLGVESAASRLKDIRGLLEELNKKLEKK